MRKLLHGKAVCIQDIGCSGAFTEGKFGTGNLSLSSRNIYDNWAIDIGEIYFAEPSEDQRLAAETTPVLSKEGYAAGGVGRRLSRIQAEYINALICKALNEELRGVIPSDDEIKSILRGGHEAEPAPVEEAASEDLTRRLQRLRDENYRELEEDLLECAALKRE